MTDWVTTLGLAMGSSWLSGVNLYATVATLGLLQRFGLARLPGDMSVLGDWWVIALALSLYAIEFVADKVPYVDNLWDAVHTFIRVPAGAALAAAAFADAGPAVRTAALLLGGGVALSSHGAKAAVRMAANASPEPFSNIALSLLEDGFAIGLSVVSVFFPVVVLVALAIFLVVFFWSVPKVVRAIRRLFARRAPSTNAA